MNITTYLFFNGRCDEAAHFYAKALGGEISLFIIQGHVFPSRDGSENIQHADVIVKDRNVVVITLKSGFAVSASVPSIGEAIKSFNILAVGWSIPHTYLGPQFGMLVDKHGVSWIIFSFS